MDKLSRWVIGIYISLYIVISFVSTMHSVSFFGMTNDVWMARSLAGAFELGQLAAMAGLMTLERSSKKLIATLMITLTAMQIMANMYFSYAHVNDALAWFELFGLQNTDPIVAKRILAAVSGGLLPLIALGFSKSLVDYLKPVVPVQVESEPLIENLPASGGATEQQIKDYMDFHKKHAAEVQDRFEARQAEKLQPIVQQTEAFEIIDKPSFVEPVQLETLPKEDEVAAVDDNIIMNNGIPTGAPTKPKKLLRDAELPDVY